MIYLKEYLAPTYHISEIKRYVGGSDEKTDALIKECIEECESINAFSYRVCYKTLPLSFSGNDIVNIGEFKLKSVFLTNKLSLMSKALVFAATLGIGIDRLILKYSSTSPAKALIFQGIGTERIEQLCDTFCIEQEKKYIKTTKRFSPGYSDFDLSAQEYIFKTLDCERKIGLHLSQNLIMSPTKSVTALFGIKE